MPPPLFSDDTPVGGRNGVVPALYANMINEDGFIIRALAQNDKDGRREYHCSHYPPHIDMINRAERQIFAQATPAERG